MFYAKIQGSSWTKGPYSYEAARSEASRLRRAEGQVAYVVDEYGRRC
jgi:hypothetical protein